MTYREEEAAASPFLVEMIERWPLGAEVREIQVGALSSTDARRLALARLGASDGLAAQAADIIARESGGSPFLIEELAGSYLALARTATATFAIPTLAEIVSARLAALPERVRRLAEVVAVAGRPVARALLAGACGEALLQEEEVELLRSERLVRPGLRDGREVVEPSHDRIRETIVAQLPPDLLREHHGRLARAFEAASASDVEAIAVHLLGSGETERALTFVERAAEQAHAKLAFDQEARLYRLALATLPRTAEKAHSIRVRLANALEQAGRGAEAAPLYLEATENAPPVERLALERSAADQLPATPTPVSRCSGGCSMPSG
jgi:tetratricopeptide (TPR) repeat protein